MELGLADDEVEAYRVLSLRRVEAVGGDGRCWGGEAEMLSSVLDVVGGEAPWRHGGADTDGEAGGEGQDDGVASLHDDDSSGESHAGQPVPLLPLAIYSPRLRSRIF